MPKMILVTGAAGFVGSHVVALLHERGYETLALDNLAKGNRKTVLAGKFAHINMGDRVQVDHLLQAHPIVAAMHFGGDIRVGESIKKPFQYYQNNCCHTLNLIEILRKHSVDKFIFSSSAAIFGDPLTETIAEDHPKNPINPYGRSKWMVEQMLEDFDKAYQFRSCSLRYFNAAGGDPNRRVPQDISQSQLLIPVLFRHVLSPKKPFEIFGNDYPTRDGTCVRDYIHVWDLAHAHLLALEHLLHGGPTAQYNLGNGAGFTVNEVIATVEKVTGRKVEQIVAARRPGDPPSLVANSSRAFKELGWIPKIPSLEAIVDDAWQAVAN